MSESSGISEKAKMYIGVGAILFIAVSIFCGGMFVGCHYKEIDCPVCQVCDEITCPTPDPCPIADHDNVEIVLYPTASVACNKVPNTDRWRCSPVEFRGPDNQPGKVGREVLIRLLEPPESAAKK